jgi:hypothetical protein
LNLKDLESFAQAIDEIPLSEFIKRLDSVEIDGKLAIQDIGKFYSLLEEFIEEQNYE